MRFVGISCGLAAALFLSGCAKARVTTMVHADGSWTRTVALMGPEKKQGQMTPTVEETFVIPSGAEWKSTEEKKSDERTLTLERRMAAGASLDGDLSIKADSSGKADAA